MAATSREKRDTIVIGASAGGIDAIRRLLPAFERTLEAAILVVIHMPANGSSVMDEVLSRSTRLETTFARDGEPILPGRVYIAPPDRHLLVDPGDRVKLWHGPHENHSRPAIDPLFRSAALARGGRVIGVVLSGLLDDGAAGLVSVKRCGGLAFVQAPSDAIEAEMPTRAAEALGHRLDGALPIQPLAGRIVELVGTEASASAAPSDIQLELDMLLGESLGPETLAKRGPPLPLSCPECGGPLWGIGERPSQRFRCHTGHAFGLESFLSAQDRQIEQALWAAIKGLEQRSQMLTELARGEDARGRTRAVSRFSEEAGRLRNHAQTLRDVLVASVAGSCLQLARDREPA